MVNSMSRSHMVALLESYGFCVYESETDDHVRRMLQANVVDGTIDEDDLHRPVCELPDCRDR